MAHAARQAQADASGGPRAQQPPSWRQSVDDAGVEAERGADALGALVGAWQQGGGAPALARAKIMPFVDADG